MSFQKAGDKPETFVPPCSGSVLRLAGLTAQAAAALPRQWAWSNREFLPVLVTHRALTENCAPLPAPSCTADRCVGVTAELDCAPKELFL